MRIVLRVLIWTTFAACVVFIGLAFLRARPEKRPVSEPVLTQAPARVYGRIEPEGGDVYVSAPITRSVIAVVVREGDSVTQGQVLCRLESSVEQANLDAARAGIETARRQAALSRDILVRNQALFEKNGIAEYELTQSRLKAELDQARLEEAERVAGQAQAALDQCELRAPVSGRVYRFDVRLGQTLAAGDNSRILLGPGRLMVRMYVESYWTSRVRLGNRYLVSDAETGDTLGYGEVTYAAPYLGRRSFRTDDPQERLDTDYQEVILSFQGLTRAVPIGLKVAAWLTDAR